MAKKNDIDKIEEVIEKRSPSWERIALGVIGILFAVLGYVAIAAYADIKSSINTLDKDKVDVGIHNTEIRSLCEKIDRIDRNVQKIVDQHIEQHRRDRDG